MVWGPQGSTLSPQSFKQIINNNWKLKPMEEIMGNSKPKKNEIDFNKKITYYDFKV